MLTQQQLADKIKCSLRTVTRMDEQTQQAWQLLAEKGKVYGYQDLIAALVFEHDVFNLKYPKSACDITLCGTGELIVAINHNGKMFAIYDPYAALAYLKEQNYAK